MSPNNRNRKPATGVAKSKRGGKARGGATSRGGGRGRGKQKDGVKEADVVSASSSTFPQASFSFQSALPSTPRRQGPIAEAHNSPTFEGGGRDEVEDPSQAHGVHQGPPDHEDSILRRLASINVTSNIAGNNFKSITYSTPYTVRSGAPTAKGQSARLEGISLAKSIGPTPTSKTRFIYDQGFARSHDKQCISAWLRSEDSDQVYGTKFLDSKAQGCKEPVKRANGAAWNLPKVVKKEAELYTPFTEILTAICDRFVTPGLGPGIEREVMDTHKVALAHDGNGNHTSPDFVVRGTGPSFEVPSNGEPVGYSNVVAFFDAKRDKQMDEDHLAQVSVYARQIFAQQPNRIFVRGLLFSERRAKLIQFDRAGSQWSPTVDLKLEPEIFIRMVIELCGGGSERKMGLDDSFHWEIKNGRKYSGYMKFGPDEKIYNLTDPRPISHSFDIRGNGITLWGVEERETGNPFTIKDSWTADGLTSEHEALEVLKDVKGVGKVVKIHLRDIKTSDFRCTSTVGAFTDRQASRVLMESHGRKIEKFREIPELLNAMCDILLAHFESYGKNILHRNINESTVFLGCEGAEVGLRGVLIDFQAALNFDPQDGNGFVSAEPRSGTRFFQSCTMLKFLTELSVGEAPPHDHMDDLETFFNLMCYLFFQFHPNGDKRDNKDRARNVVKGWDSDSPDEALAFKSLLFNPALGQKGVAIEIVSDSWGPACGRLFEKFLEWVWDIQQKKGAILQERRKKQREADRKEKLKRQMELKAKELQKDSKGRKNPVRMQKAPKGSGSKNKEVEKLDETKEQVAELRGSAQAEPTVVDEDSLAVDQTHTSVVLDAVGATTPKAETTGFKDGVFATLIENGMAGHHYDTVISFFIVAATEIELSPDQNEPPPVPPSRPLKRKKSNDDKPDVEPKRARRVPAPP